MTKAKDEMPTVAPIAAMISRYASLSYQGLPMGIMVQSSLKSVVIISLGEIPLREESDMFDLYPKFTFGFAVGVAVAVILLFLFFVVLPLYILYVDIVSLYGADAAILGGFLYWFFHW